jgi:hypothetical protein
MSKSNGSSENQHNEVRVVYTAPVLRKYGNLRSLTQAVGMNGMMDGGVLTGMMRTNA